MSQNALNLVKWDENQIMDDQTPNTTRIFRLFRKLAKSDRQSAEETHELVELINNMAGSNVIERLEAKIDVQNTKYNVLIWMVGSFGAAIIIVLTILALK